MNEHTLKVLVFKVLVREVNDFMIKSIIHTERCLDEDEKT